MDIKFIAVSGIAVIFLMATLVVISRATYRFVMGVYPPTRHVIKLDDNQLRQLKDLLRTTKRE